MDLLKIFEEINLRHFDGFLDAPVLRWNGRLRTSAGRFFPGTRRKVLYVRPPIIEIASYLQTEQDAETHIRETLAHEMIHYWLWVRRRPHGHSDEFYSKMEAMGARRYNPVPRLRPHKYLYGCAHCSAEFKSRKLLGKLACASCCKAHAGGRYAERFRLVLLQKLSEKLGPAVLLVSAGILSGFSSAKSPDSLWMARDDGSRQCEGSDARALESGVRQELAGARVEVLELRHVPASQAGGMRIMLCGSPTGARFEVRVRADQKAPAEKLGFKSR